VAPDKLKKLDIFYLPDAAAPGFFYFWKKYGRKPEDIRKRTGMTAGRIRGTI